MAQPRILPPLPRFQQHPATAALVSHMKAVTAKGTVLSYAQAAKIAGGGFTRQRFRSAVGICRNAHGQNWLNIPNEGYFLADPLATADTVQKVRLEIARKARKNSSMIENVIEDADAKTKGGLLVMAAYCGAIERASHVSRQKKLAAAVEKYGNKNLPPSIALEEIG